jgi:hypothetical protein
MTVLASPDTTTTTASAAGGVRRGALSAGVLAGPLFVTTAVVQILTRDGFDLTRHPISLLANGEYGWVQSANFIVAGLLGLIFAYGVAPHLRGGRGAIAGPVLFMVYGVGLITGGVFKADPAMGFPAGAPPGYPEQISTSSVIHAFAPPLAFLRWWRPAWCWPAGSPLRVTASRRWSPWSSRSRPSSSRCRSARCTASGSSSPSSSASPG